MDMLQPPSGASAPASGPMITAALDLEAVAGFVAGRSCLLRVQVRSDGATVEGLTLAAELSGHPLGVTQALAARVAPGALAELVLAFVPALAGQHTLALRLRGQVAGGSPFEATTAEPLPVQVGDAAAPQVLHIDQSNARVIDNSRSTFGAASGGGLLAERRWHGLRMTMATVVSDSATLGAPAPVRLVPPPPHRPRVVSFRVTTPLAAWEASVTLATGELATLFEADGGAAGAPREPVVLKIVDASADNDLMLNEARALERLAGPPEGGPTGPSTHIPQLRDRFRTGDGRIGHVLPRLDGMDLFEVRRRCPDGLPTRHVLWVLRRSLAALAHAHACGLLHGNVDPSHLVIRPRDHMVWLVDWCWAVIEPARSGDRFKAHNEVFSPPEVAERKTPWPASDLYALGKCMFFLAGGDPVAKTLPAHVEAPLERLLRYLVVESPRGRAQDAAEVYREAERVREKIWGPHVFVPLEI